MNNQDPDISPSHKDIMSTLHPQSSDFLLMQNSDKILAQLSKQQESTDKIMFQLSKQQDSSNCIIQQLIKQHENTTDVFKQTITFLSEHSSSPIPVSNPHPHSHLNPYPPPLGNSSQSTPINSNNWPIPIGKHLKPCYLCKYYGHGANDCPNIEGCAIGLCLQCWTRNHDSESCLYTRRSPPFKPEYRAPNIFLDTYLGMLIFL